MSTNLISAATCTSIKTHPRIVLQLHWGNRSWRCVFHTDSSVILHNSGPHLCFSICKAPCTILYTYIPTFSWVTWKADARLRIQPGTVWDPTGFHTSATTKSHTLPINQTCRLCSSSISIPFSLFVQNIQVTLLSKARRTGHCLDHLCWFIFGINAWWWNPTVFLRPLLKFNNELNVWMGSGKSYYVSRSQSQGFLTISDKSS